MPEAFLTRADLLHRDLTILQGRGVAGIDDARAVEAVFAVLAFPLAAIDGLDEAPDDGEVPFAGLYLGLTTAGTPATSVKMRTVSLVP